MELQVKPGTVDTGKPSDVFPGAVVTWMRVPVPVDAKVLGHSLRPYTKVTIEVKTKNGASVVRRVDAKNLRWRK
jgi:archaellin